MTAKIRILPKTAAIGVAALLATIPVRVNAQQNSDQAPRIGGSDLGGVVAGASGAEAGVWVIAETTGLPTPFAKMVVTDDQGRYLIPDLPQANYDVWVRGYGPSTRRGSLRRRAKSSI